MSRPTEEVDQIEEEVRKIPGNYYSARGGRRRIYFPNATLLDGDLMEDACNLFGDSGGAAAKIDEGDGNLYFGPHYPGFTGRRIWADEINQSIGPAALVTHKYGPLQSLSDEGGEPFLMTEWVNALLNVKKWRMAGEVGGVSFDVTAWAGTDTNYLPDLATGGDWETPAEARAAWATRLLLDNYEVGDGEGGSVEYRVGWAGAPTRILDRYFSAPSRLQTMPYLDIHVRSGGGSTVVRLPDAYLGEGLGPGTVDENITWLGRPVRTVANPDFGEDPPSYVVNITAAEYWTDEPWYGAETWT
jgi:hypothetical protein